MYYNVFKQYLQFEKGDNNIVNHGIPQVKPANVAWLTPLFVSLMMAE